MNDEEHTAGGGEGSGGGEGDDLSMRRERVVALVQARIASAPPFTRTAAPWMDITAWTVPALAAAAIVIAASIAELASTPGDRATAGTVVEALGLSAPLTTFVTTGEVDPWSWLYPGGSPP